MIKRINNKENGGLDTGRSLPEEDSDPQDAGGSLSSLSPYKLNTEASDMNRHF